MGSDLKRAMFVVVVIRTPNIKQKKKHRLTFQQKNQKLKTFFVSKPIQAFFSFYIRDNIKKELNIKILFIN